ncbi:MAG TPA: hypothetical protein VFJ51_06650 [Nitrososphaeraceae archaeon]|nr:hypothetical protein [Nitrososphaeraceae archaeon]
MKWVAMVISKPLGHAFVRENIFSIKSLLSMTGGLRIIDYVIPP